MSWYITRKDLPAGREAYVYPLLFGRARLGVGSLGGPFDFDDEW